MSGEILQLCAAKVTGAIHRRKGDACQDAVLSEQEDPFLAMLAVADGHSKSKHGAKGAELAVQVALRVFRWILAEEQDLQTDQNLRGLQDLLTGHLRGQIVRSWRRLVREQDPKGELVDYGTTLLCALWTPRYLLQIQLGDGDMILVEGGLPRFLVSAVEGNLGDETLSLASPMAEQGIYTLLRPAPRGSSLLLLSTDGYSKSYDYPDAMLNVALDYHRIAKEHGFPEVERRLPEILERTTLGGCGDDIACAVAFSKEATTPGGEIR